MSSEIVIDIDQVSKCFNIYDNPRNRLKQFFLPKIQKMFGLRIKKYYREFWALKNVSFKIKKGETIGIVGSNGSGKSTLLQLICGTLYPSSGNVKTTGRIAALLELGSGFNPEFTGRENVFLNGSLLGLSKSEIENRFESIVSFADIGEFIDHPVKTYSSGMFVRLAFAIQANVEPEILIVDEALAVGDAYFVHRCMLRFNELQKAGTTILFVSHDANAVRNLCDRAIWIDSGIIKEEGDSSKVIDDYLAHLFDQKKSNFNLEKMTKEEDAFLQSESSIPNIDRRLGDQKCEIVGAGFYNSLMQPISSTFNEEKVILRISARNNSLDSNIKLVFGYVFRNSKGQEIASSNSHIENSTINSVSIKKIINVCMKIELPCLHPGSYAFCIAVGFINDKEDIIVTDRIDNVIVFELFSKKHVHTLMNFRSVFETEII